MRVTLLVLLMGLSLGCSGANVNPVTFPTDKEFVTTPSETDSEAGKCGEGPYRLWGEWTFFIDKNHESIDAIPKRSPRFHLNATKFLEEYCADCLKIINIKNNGDDTFDLTVSIKHPFPGFPEYTGFDVKGILMFNGSLEYANPLNDCGLPNPYRISLKELGDPEVLNSDGYTPRWSPSYEDTGDIPIFQYWDGKYARGTPNGGLNAYLNFYTNEDRHYFASDGIVQRTYKIWLPPGEPIVAAYAIEACWEPPIKMPVTDPVSDFPITANQPEPYHFQMVINNDQEITDCLACCYETYCEKLYLEIKTWYVPTPSVYVPTSWDIFVDGGLTGFTTSYCTGSDYKFHLYGFEACRYDNGIHRGHVAYLTSVDGVTIYCAWDFFEWNLNDPNH